MNWASILAYVTGTVDQELLLRNEYLTPEGQVEGEGEVLGRRESQAR